MACPVLFCCHSRMQTRQAMVGFVLFQHQKPHGKSKAKTTDLGKLLIHVNVMYNMQFVGLRMETRKVEIPEGE